MVVASSLPSHAANSPTPTSTTSTTRIKFQWLVVGFFLLQFSAHMTTIESFVVPPMPWNELGTKTRTRRTTTIATTITKTITTTTKRTPAFESIATKLFQTVGGGSNADTSGSMEFRGIPNKPIQNERKYNVSLLVIDHYDSFTYNLCDMLAQLTFDPPVVVAKDAIDASNDDDETMSSFFDRFDGIVLSPGPGTPEEQPALSHKAITENPDLPVFGVCLGHQLMALAYGARVNRAPVPIHGQDHRIVQNEETQDNNNNDNNKNGNKHHPNPSFQPSSRYPSLFEDLPTSFRVVRYHSLCAYDLPENLTVTARSGDEVVQAIQHESNPHYGVQFHPESIGTENGMKLLENFLRVVEHRKSEREEEEEDDDDDDDASTTAIEIPLDSKDPPLEVSPSTNDASQASASRFKIMVHRISGASVTSSKAFERYYSRQSHSIWLDSSSSHTGRGELDILAAPSRSEDIIEYHIDDNKNGNEDILTRLEKELFGDGQHGATSSSTDFGWVTWKTDETALKWTSENDDCTNKRSVQDDLPFNYRGGYLGFLGYEVRHDTQRYLQQLEGGHYENETSEKTSADSTENSESEDATKDGFRQPTAAFFLARQSMVYHHPTGEWYLVGLAEDDSDVEENLEWMKSVDSDFKSFTHDGGSEVHNASPPSEERENSNRPSVEFVPNRPKETYESDIEKCHEYIRKGDSYELCLTNQLEARISGKCISTFDLYKTIREVNPAPYSSYFRWNLASKTVGNQNKAADQPLPTSLVICSSSPERFMSVSRKQPHPEMAPFLQAEAKPIKGTCARVMPENGICRTEAETREDDRRARSLELSLKNRAENLMIVDLLRNDMSRVCKTGSVHVSKLMGIESFATVHQMVSTIRGTLSDSYNAIDLLRASFPGGSMTGAPKIRTMEILEELEENVDRGVYSGSLGYLSVNGCMDMNIMIRSATVTPSDEKKDEWKISIGAGGAITALSDAEDEYAEMLLKARAVREAVEKWAGTIDTTNNEIIALDSEKTDRNTTDIYVES